MKVFLAFFALILSTAPSAAADKIWACDFPGDTPQHKRFAEREREIAELDVPIYQFNKMTMGELVYPTVIKTTYTITAVQASQIFSEDPKVSLAHAMVLMIDLRTLNATLTQIVTSVEAGGIIRGTCKPEGESVAK